VLREPLRYAPGSRGNACARPASSRIRSCRSSDCNHHHLSKSICKVHRVHIYMYTSIYGSLSCEGLVTLFVMCDLGDTLQHLKELPIRRFLLQCERSAVLLKILSRILPQKDREEVRKVSSSGMI